MSGRTGTEPFLCLWGRKFSPHRLRLPPISEFLIINNGAGLTGKANGFSGNGAERGGWGISYPGHCWESQSSSSGALRLGVAILICGWLIFKSALKHGRQPYPYPSLQQIPEKHQLLLYWLCQSLWLCRSQQTVENSPRDGTTRSPYLPPEKSVCRSRSNS